MPNVENLSLRQISDELLPIKAAEIQKVAAETLSRGERVLHITKDFSREHFKDDAALAQLYEVVDRLRIAAKDVQNYIDRSLLLTHGFVPIIESTYPCHGGNKAVSLAHSLHLGLGRVKEAVGGGGHGLPTTGAADLLADTERALGSVTGHSPDGLQPMLEEKDGNEENAIMAFAPSALGPCFDRRWIRLQRFL